jgi:hypothetical protein
MSKNTINYLFLSIGTIILIYGFIDLWVKNTRNEFNIFTVLIIFSGIFIVSKILRKTKELPSKSFKDRLKEKD